MIIFADHVLLYLIQKRPAEALLSPAEDEPPSNEEDGDSAEDGEEVGEDIGGEEGDTDVDPLLAASRVMFKNWAQHVHGSEHEANLKVLPLLPFSSVLCHFSTTIDLFTERPGSDDGRRDDGESGL